MLSFIENILTGVKMWTDEHKQNKLTAGDNIKINGDTISATNDNSWREIKVNDHTFLSSATTSGSLTLSAGTNVVLTDSNGVVTINSQGGGGSATYSAGSNINIDNTNHIISAIGYTFNNTTKSFSESVGNTASGSYAHAEGYNTNAVGMRSHAEGHGVASVGSTSHAEGGGVEGTDYWKKFTTGSTLTVTSGSTGATINKLNVLLLSSSTSETVSKLSIGDIIIYEGASVVITDMLFDFDSTTLVFDRPWHNKTFSNVDISTINNGDDIKFFVFRYSVSLGAYSHIEGEHNITYGRDSHAEGNWTKAIGDYSHAEGSITTASGVTSHAEGSGTTASGLASHAEGSGTTASGSTSHAEGSRTTASGNYSHAEGNRTTASGSTSHAEGSGTTASGDYSHAGGLGTIANRAQMTAIGKYNKEGVVGTLFAVGNGVDSANTSNAFTVHSGGSFTATATVNGVADVYLGCPIGTIVMWAGEEEPYGWLLCSGGTISVTAATSSDYDYSYTYGTTIVYRKATNSEYRNLVKVIARHYGRRGLAVDSEVLLPNLQQRFPLGASTSTNIGTTGGTSAVTLTTDQMPSHNHKMNFIDGEMADRAPSYTAETETEYVTGFQMENAIGGIQSVKALRNVNTLKISGNTAETQKIINDTGGGNSHNNMPPYLTINYIIKYM